jgi:23S rRNA pseudouridine1911/1915/1917 synthase
VWTRDQHAGADIGPRLLHEADGLLVIDKPAGLPSTGATLDDPWCAQHMLMTRARRRVWAVHQLDALTSGVNVFVRRKALVAEVSAKMRHSGAKRYLGLCHGVPTFEQTSVDAPIGWIEDARRRGVTDEGDAARTDVQVLATGTDVALVRCTMRSGRNHQLRIHLAHLGHPLLGEGRYREPPCDRHIRHALHASELRLSDGPVFRARLPEDLRELAICSGIAPDVLAQAEPAS